MQAKRARTAIRGSIAPRIFALVCALSLAAPGMAQQTPQPVNSEVSVSSKDGYGRIVIRMTEEVESNIKAAGGIVIVSFRRPVNIPVETITSGLPDYIGAARRDPDGRGLRIALNRKATVNSMAAGERLFIDLLPDTWTGLPPGLPQEVIEELAHRAREAEKLLRMQRKQATPAPMRVRVAVQPTFTRYVFELPEILTVSVDRGKDELSLTFGAPIKFDLADAHSNSPAVVKSIESKAATDTTSVQFRFTGKADIRTFREDNNYVVDINSSNIKDGASGPDDPSGISANGRKGLAPLIDAPQVVPAQPSKTDKPPNGKPSAKADDEPAARKSEAGATQSGQSGQSGERKTPDVAKPAAASPAKATVAQEDSKDGKSSAGPSAKPAAEAGREQADKSTDAAVAPKPAGNSAPSPQAATAPAPEATSKLSSPGTVAARLSGQNEKLQLTFPFSAPTPAAIFQRADTLWLLFDTNSTIDLSALGEDVTGSIRSGQLIALPDAQVVRIKLARPRLMNAALRDAAWVVEFGESVSEPPKSLGLVRNVAGAARPSVIIPFEQPGKLFRIADPDIGDTLLVVSALGPVRGLVKTQDFVEFNALASLQGLAIQPLADDVRAELAADRVVLGRPGGLTLSGASVAQPQSKSAYRPAAFDAQLWGFDRGSKYGERQYKLIGAAADAPPSKRAAARYELARFYLAQDMFAEAKGVVDAAIVDEQSGGQDSTPLVLRAIANIMLNRPEEALKELANPVVGDQYDAPLWRAFALARMGKWAEARQGFRNIDASIAGLPLELQRLAMKEALQAAIEVRDYAGADAKLSEFETIGIPHEMQPAVLVLTGKLAQGLGRNQEALDQFRQAAESGDRPAAAQAQLRETALRYGLGELQRGEVIGKLETLTALWRGDQTEIEALQLLARLYTEEGRNRDAFHVLRTALRAHPQSEVTRKIQNEASANFDALFLAGKADSMAAIDALSLFYDFRELTPIGRRGDEMIRRLADRLVSVDLLPQAAELLQHQIDNRLQGAARSQIAARLAVVYLMDRKPDRAIAVLRSSRMAELSTELRQLRLLLEARALSDLGRHDLALEVIGNIDRREAVRLRADILWASKRYGEAAEQIELLHGQRWKEFDPLTDAERGDILRAAIGYALSEDQIGLGRLREKYAGKMADGADRQAFDIATGPFGAAPEEFRVLAQKISASDTLSSFLSDMRAGYPEIGAMSKIPSAPGKAMRETGDKITTGSVRPERRAAH